jgi:hypothetical protein
VCLLEVGEIVADQLLYSDVVQETHYCFYTYCKDASHYVEFLEHGDHKTDKMKLGNTQTEMSSCYYHDHSNEQDSLDFLRQHTGLIPPHHHLFSSICQQQQQGGGGRMKEHSFPVKLHDMLDQIDNAGLSHIVSWQPHGRCIVVHKPVEFALHILPRYGTEECMVFIF